MNFLDFIVYVFELFVNAKFCICLKYTGFLLISFEVQFRKEYIVCVSFSLYFVLYSIWTFAFVIIAASGYDTSGHQQRYGSEIVEEDNEKMADVLADKVKALKSVSYNLQTVSHCLLETQLAALDCQWVSESVTQTSWVL